ncbi:MAG: transposase, partial [Candidatus Competibacteraceae bacterium]|nr:transposase [Candidatus Competibacteraceae bacterium]
MLLQEGTARFGYQVHGFCLLDNHFHLLIQVGHIALSKLMQNLAFRYTRWVNRSQDRVGHLFQGRYRAILIDQDHYLLDLVRYIHLN